jgi:hypothetical protein
MICSGLWNGNGNTCVAVKRGSVTLVLGKRVDRVSARVSIRERQSWC